MQSKTSPRDAMMTARPHRWLRLLGRSLAGLVAVVVGLGAIAALALLVFGREIAGRVIAWQLGEAGLEPRSLAVTELGLEHIAVENLAFGEGLTVDRVTVDYRPGALLRERRVDRILVEGAVLTARIDAEGAIVIDGIELGGAPEDGPIQVPALPVGEVAIRESELRLDTPVGPVSMPLAATLEPMADGGLSARAELQPESAAGAGAILLTATVSGDGLLSASAEISDATLRTDQATAIGLEGWFAGSLPLDDPTARELDVSLTAERVNLAGDLVFEPVQLIYRDRAGPRFALLSAGRPDDPAAFSIEATAGPDDLALQASAAVNDPRPVRALGELLGLELAAERARGEAALSLPLSNLSDPQALLPLEGEVRLAGTGLRVGREAHIPEIDLGGRLRVEEGRVRLEGDRPLRVGYEGDGVEGEVELAALGSASPTVLATWGEDGIAGVSLSGDLDGAFTAAFGSGSIAGATDLMLALGGEDLRFEAALDQGTVDLAMGDAILSGTGVSLQAAGTPDEAEADVSGRLAGGYAAAETSVAVEPSDLRLRADLSGGVVTLRAAGCQPVTAVRYGRTDLRIEVGALSICPTDGRLLTYRLEEGTLDAAVTLPEAATLSVADGGGTLVSGAAPAIEAALTLDQGVDLRATMTGGDLNASGAVLRNADADIHWRDAEEPWLTAEIRRLDIRHAALADFGGGGSFQGRASGSGGLLEASGIVTAGGLRGALTARHDLANGQGTAGLRAGPFTFDPEGLQPAALWPPAGTLGFEEVSGRAGASITFGWTPALWSRAELTFEDVFLVADAADVAGLNGTIRLRSLDPPILDGAQELAIDALDVGVLLENGRIVLSGSADALRVESIGFDWADGRLTAPSFTIGSGGGIDAVLVAEGVDASIAGARLPLEGLTVTGILDGRVPIRIAGETIVIADGRLESRSGGLIQYRPDETPSMAQGGDESVDLLLDAVRNFHYERLVLTLNGRTGEDLVIGLSINGANPDLYDGYPIALNVNVSGELDQILRRAIEASTIGSRVGDLFR